MHDTQPAAPSSDGQNCLFDTPADSPSDVFASLAAGPVGACPPAPDVQALAHALNERHAGRLHLGTSSWYFPGWAGLVWERAYSEASVVRHGLRAYAQHPLLSTVSLDRSFYRPLDAATYARLAAQVPASFRFIVKMLASVTDATLRAPGKSGTHANAAFLEAGAAVSLCAQPALAGLGNKLGVLLLQLSPLPQRWLGTEGQAELHTRLAALLDVLVPMLPAGAVVALELRDAALLTPQLAALLKACGARYCLGLHDRMPPVDEQLPMLRATWPGALVCRWNLQRGLAYEQARNRFEPFNRLAAPDLTTRQALARLIHANASAGQAVFVAVNNKAEGSAPLSVVELAREVVALGVAPRS